MDLSKYMKDVEALETQYLEVTKALHQAKESNESVQGKYDALVAAGLGEEAIRAAMDVEFGVETKTRRPRSPNLGKKPTEVEVKLLQAMDDEGKNKASIFKEAGIEITDENKSSLSRLANLGFVKNVGGKGLGASWALTEEGRKVAEA